MLGPYAAFIVSSYAAVALVVLLLIGWVALDYRAQKTRLRELEARGAVRRSGRSCIIRAPSQRILTGSGIPWLNTSTA